MASSGDAGNGASSVPRRDIGRSTREALKSAAWSALYWPWVLRSRFRSKISIATDDRLVVIIPTYNPSRMRDLDPLIRFILRCTFINKIIVSNHNPAVSLASHVRTRDPRVVLLDQPVRRGPGFVWEIASSESANYFLSVDDDVLLSPKQIALLFTRLLEQPEVPHGLAGRVGSTYVQGRDQPVDWLHMVYAVTKTHVHRYLNYVRELAESRLASSDNIEHWANDILMSTAGTSRPLIHDAGFLLQGRTCFHPDVAIHRQVDFQSRRAEILAALSRSKAAAHTAS